MSEPAKLKLAQALIDNNGKHPSPEAPQHLMREKQELIQYDETLCWLTESQLALLKAKWEPEQLDYWINQADDYFQDEKIYKKYKSHYRTIKHWHEMKTQKGMAWADLPGLGTGYFYLNVIERAQR